MNDPTSDDGGPLQEWARALGLGEPTGLDVGGEGAGRVPTPERRNDAYAREHRARLALRRRRSASTRGRSPTAPWSVGDNVNLAVGQGDLQADPLQMAVAYAAIANGGDIVRPHVGLAGRRSAGAGDPGDRPGGPRPRRDRPARPSGRSWTACTAPRWSRTGTSYPVFGGYPVDIAGKTGTAERPRPGATSPGTSRWRPYDDPKYVVAVTIERGGFGADTAAPAARRSSTSC